MITLVEARGFRCLQLARQPLGAFQVLAGANGSGKSTFLDVLGFLGAVVARGPQAAVRERAARFEELTWQGEGGALELAIEAAIPEGVRGRLASTAFETVRYEVGLGAEETGDTVLVEERVVLKSAEGSAPRQLEMFPRHAGSAGTILSGRSGTARTIVHKVPGGNDNFYSETHQDPGKGWVIGYKLGRGKAALGSLPEDASRFPVTLWLRALLTGGIHRAALNPARLREARPPGERRVFDADGSWLPWAIRDLRARHADRFGAWLLSLREALPDLEDVDAVEREEDRHAYVVLRYRDGLEVPAWGASSGTMRLLALTLPVFAPDQRGVLIVEEPEDGLDPAAAGAAVRALSSMTSGAQVLLATQSEAIVGAAAPERVLCFARGADGHTEIVPGGEHPGLGRWWAEAGTRAPAAGGVLG